MAIEVAVSAAASIGEWSAARVFVPSGRPSEVDYAFARTANVAIRANTLTSTTIVDVPYALGPNRKGYGSGDNANVDNNCRRSNYVTCKGQRGSLRVTSTPSPGNLLFSR